LDVRLESLTYKETRMGFLHRLFARRAPEVWRAEARLLHLLGYVQPPRAVQWVSTSACDLTCPHCYSHAGRKSHGELTTDEARRLIIDELVRLERPTFVIAGGETLLRPDFPAIIEHAHDRGVPWAIHTHGGRVEKLLDVFERFPPVMAAVSLDGPRDYHDTFRGRAGSFDAALRAMQALKLAGCREVVAGTTVTRANADLLADLVPTILASGADSWGLHLMTPEGRAAAHRDLLATPAQLRRVAALARRLRSLLHVELDNEWGSAGGDDCFYRDDRFMCGAGRISCVVSATGDVMACTTTDPAESQGNIRERPLSRIWADGFAAFRSTGDKLRSDVSDCWLQTRNGHSCRGPAFFDGWAAGTAAGARRLALPLAEMGGAR
jgi:radical SAM protein with 4Fe4S-binding SPASM domain